MQTGFTAKAHTLKLLPPLGHPAYIQLSHDQRLTLIIRWLVNIVENLSTTSKMHALKEKYTFYFIKRLTHLTQRRIHQLCYLILVLKSITYYSRVLM